MAYSSNQASQISLSSIDVFSYYNKSSLVCISSSPDGSHWSYLQRASLWFAVWRHWRSRSCSEAAVPKSVQLAANSVFIHLPKPNFTLIGGCSRWIQLKGSRMLSRVLTVFLRERERDVRVSVSAEFDVERWVTVCTLTVNANGSLFLILL